MRKITFVNKIIFVTLIVTVIYLSIGILTLVSANASELLAYQFVSSRTLITNGVLPIPFGDNLSNWLLLRKQERELLGLTPYMILRFSEELSIEGKNQGYSLEEGSIEKSFAIASLLISSGLDVDAEDQDGCTSLQLAIEDEQKQIIEFLIEKNASIDKFNPNSQWQFCRVRPIDLAQKKGVDLPTVPTVPTGQAPSEIE